MITQTILGKEWTTSTEGVHFLVADVRNQDRQAVVPFRKFEEILYLIDKGEINRIIRILTPRHVWKKSTLSMEDFINHRDTKEDWKIIVKDSNGPYGYALGKFDMSVPDRASVSNCLEMVQTNANVLVRVYKPQYISDLEFEVLTGLNMLCNIYMHMSSSRNMEPVFKLYNKAKKEFISAMGWDKKNIKPFEPTSSNIYNIKEMFDRE